MNTYILLTLVLLNSGTPSPILAGANQSYAVFKSSTACEREREIFIKKIDDSFGRGFKTVAICVKAEE